MADGPGLPTKAVPPPRSPSASHDRRLQAAAGQQPPPAPSPPVYLDPLVAKYLKPKFKWAAPVLVAVDRYFQISMRGSSFTTEFIGGSTTFFSGCYIMAINPIILQPTGIPLTSLFFSTTLAAALFTFVMGAAVNLPIMLAPGMGLNALLATACAQGSGYFTWPQGMAAVLLSGVLYLVLTVTGLRYYLFKAVPAHLKLAVSVGIGLYLTLVGFKNSSMTQVTYIGPYGGGNMTMTPPVIIPNGDWALGTTDLKDPVFAAASGRTSVLGIMFVCLFLTLKIPGGILLSIVLTTLAGIGEQPRVTDLSDWETPGGPTNFLPQTALWRQTAGQFDFSLAGQPRFWELVWTLLFVEMFDSLGTISACVARGGPAITHSVGGDVAVLRAMLVDGFGLVFGSVLGSNSVTAYIESLTGIEAGARTGFASIVTACWFFLSLLFVYPFVALIPNAAVFPALLMVGVYSIPAARDIDWGDFPTAFAAFLTIASMPFLYSIANGIAAGFIFDSFANIVRCTWNVAVDYAGRPHWRHERHAWPHPLMIMLSVFMSLRFAYLD